MDDLESSQTSHALPALALAILKLGMVDIYGRRREAQLAKYDRQTPDEPGLLRNLVELLAYYEHTSAIRSVMRTVHDTLFSLSLFQPDSLLLQFDNWLDQASDLLATARKGKLQIGGAAFLLLGDHSIDLTFSAPRELAIVLSTRTVSLPSIAALGQTMQHAVHAAVVNRLSHILHDQTRGITGWQVKTLPEMIAASTRALAHRLENGAASEYV